MTEKKKRILVCPLDWGIGHAARCIPLIRCLQENGAEVIVGASGNPLAFLRQALPGLSFVEFPGLTISYPSDDRMSLNMLRLAPHMLMEISKEHRILDKLILDHRIDGVVSDNRFGLWSRRVPSVYMTHQVMIKTPGNLRFLEPVIFRLHRWFIRHYAQCWVPDHPGNDNLSGELSHRHAIREKIRFIGPLSRFHPFLQAVCPPAAPGRPDLLVLLSGPEPQRTILEKTILGQASAYPGKEIVLLQGLPGRPHPGKTGKHITIYSHLPDEEMLYLIRESRRLLCRPGYSTIMDLDRIGRKAFFIPTPGQTEQEYLARHHEKSGIHTAMDQKMVNLQDVFEREEDGSTAPKTSSEDALRECIVSFLGMIR